MRRSALLTTLLMCCTTSHPLAGYLGTARPAQPPKGFSESAQSAMVGGDTFATATPIPGLPYAEGGTTCGFVDDYIPACQSSTAPDVVYAITPATSVCVDIALCGSTFDTAISVYENTIATLVVCQDDSPDCGLQSHVTSLALTAGNTYYIVIDGYGAACGDYTLNVSECPPPPSCDPCPPLAASEGEPVCGDGYNDSYNAGCNSVPTTVTNLLCQSDVTVCGTHGTFNANGSRDTDWYEVTINAPTTINASVEGFGLTGTALAIVDNLCPPTILCEQLAPAAQCATVTCSATVAAGTYRIFVASLFDDTPCGSTYVLNISGLTCESTATQISSWGALKTLYR